MAQPGKNSGSTVVVCGDVMIDRAWIIGGPAVTSQAHAEIQPAKVIHPGIPDSRPGGAGLTASWLARRRRHSVWLLARGGDDGIARLLRRAHVKPCEDLVVRDSRTTTKFRVLTYQGAGRPPRLAHRFDLDVTVPRVQLPSDLPQDPSLVVIADFMKGIVTESLLSALAMEKRYQRIPWLIDSKNSALVTGTWIHKLSIRPTLFVNREEFARLLARTEPFLGTWAQLEEPLLSAAERFHQAHPRWDLVVKLDSEGAVTFWRDGHWQFVHKPVAKIDGAAGIGAGDAFLAGWAEELLQGSAMEQRLVGANTRGSVWLEVSERGFWKGAATPTSSIAWPADVKVRQPRFASSLSSQKVATRLTQLKQARDVKYVLQRGSLDLSAGLGHCGKFSALDPEQGAAIRRFVSELKQFFKPGRDGHDSAASRPRRPLNCLVWAAPGSGKSFFVEEAAEAVKARFKEINVTQMVSQAQLLQELAAARNIDSPKVLVLIDECWAPVEGKRVFGALLDPLWKATATKHVAFVLVDSHQGGQSDISDVGGFVDAIRAERDHKGPDLVSRLNGPTLTLKEPTPLDRATMVARLIKKNFPNVYAVERAVVEALSDKPTGKGAKWSPRSIEYVAEALQPMGGCVRLSDLQDVADLCSRLGVRLPKNARAGSEIEIKN